MFFGDLVGSFVVLLFFHPLKSEIFHLVKINAKIKCRGLVGGVRGAGG